jgi:hypothetical protein
MKPGVCGAPQCPPGRDAPPIAQALQQDYSGMFRLDEYVQAEREFVAEALTALSDSRGGIAGLVGREPTSRPGSTRVTLDSGETVEFETTEVGATMAISHDDVVETNAGAILAAIDEGAAQHHEALTRFILSNLEQLTEATGNTVDASGKPLFEAVYELFDKLELTFEEDGSVSKGFAMVASPDVVEKMMQLEAEMTPDQRKKFEDLMDRKREAFFARRRRRELS